ncbi:glycine cleavage system protein GcvH [Devosia sp.]|uniref:glycine cleavage system protein GcvH n=1 Tax=Devosia sp. TaxID=1871048 RepID=UPI0032638626
MTTKFTTDHEYIRVDGGVTGTVGITSYAQEQLGDIVFVDLPAVGKVLNKGDEAAVVESVKAASEIYAPVSGTVTEVNAALTGEPGLVNQDPAGAGWMFKIALATPLELDGLLDDAGYAELIK